MPVFPLAAAIVVVLDGRQISSYNQAFVSAGRVFAPVRPYVTAMSDRTWYEGDRLAIARDGHVVYVVMRPSVPEALSGTYVPLAAVARELGAQVEYGRGRLVIRTAPRVTVGAPTPVPGRALVEPRIVFTAAPIPTPKPVWSGPPLPRRTPLPYASPAPPLTHGNRSQIFRTKAARFGRS